MLASNQLDGSLTRAYYAVFQCVRALLFEKEVFAKTHQGIHTKFHELYLKTNELPYELGLILQDLSELRQATDYDVDFEASDNEIERAIEDTAFFIETVKNHLEK